jgi:hypothetical protein
MFTFNVVIDYPAADVLVEVAVLKHIGHVFHVADVPSGDVAVELALAKHSSHAHNIADVNGYGSGRTFRSDE